MSVWFSKTLEYLNNSPPFNKERFFGNHSVVKRQNQQGNTEIVFKYYGSDIVVVNLDKETIVVNDFGYTRGYTPRSINEILRHYEDDDYTIEAGGYTTHGQYDFWYNKANKYLVKVFDANLSEYSNYSYFNKINIPSPIISTIVDIDTESKKEFRDKYFNRLCDGSNLRFLEKGVFCVAGHMGIGYKYCSNNYGKYGTVLFEPISSRRTRKRYLFVK